jgi:hypothetical protein
MRTILLGLLAAAAIAIATPVVPASAQVTVDTPVGGVRVGHDHYRDYDSPRYRGYARHGDAALSPSPATTDLSKESGAATKSHRRTMLEAHPVLSTRRALAMAQ